MWHRATAVIRFQNVAYFSLLHMNIQSLLVFHYPFKVQKGCLLVVYCAVFKYEQDYLKHFHTKKQSFNCLDNCQTLKCSQICLQINLHTKTVLTFKWNHFVPHRCVCNFTCKKRDTYSSIPSVTFNYGKYEKENKHMQDVWLIYFLIQLAIVLLRFMTTNFHHYDTKI